MSDSIWSEPNAARPNILFVREREDASSQSSVRSEVQLLWGSNSGFGFQICFPTFQTCAPKHCNCAHHPGGNPGANLKSISHRCFLREVACEWELTKETIYLTLGRLQGGEHG